MRTRAVSRHALRRGRLVAVLALAGAVAPLQNASADLPVAVTQVRLLAPDNVGAGSAAAVRAQLTLHSTPLAGRDVTFVSRALGGSQWRALGTATTGSSGWAALTLRRVRRATEVGAYFSGMRGIAASRMATRGVHVVGLVASVPHRVRVRAAARLAGKVTLDGRGVPSQPVQFLVRHAPGRSWHSLAQRRADDAGWARMRHRFRRTLQIGVRFRGGSGLAPAPMAVSTLRVWRPVRTPAFVFPFAQPSIVDPQGLWTQDQGVDVGTRGDTCGADAVLVAVGNGVVVQEGIDGFGPTAPVLRMTSGPFEGRNVYYGHTGHNYVHVGDHVQAGQRVSQVGCGIVGRSSGPHLEIGVGVAGGPTCCPGWHQTSGAMLRRLVGSDPR